MNILEFKRDDFKDESHSVTTAANTKVVSYNENDQEENSSTNNINLLIKYLEQNTPQTNKFIFDNLIKLSSLDQQRKDQMTLNYKNNTINNNRKAENNLNYSNVSNNLLNNKTGRRKPNSHLKTIECPHKEAPHYAKVLKL